MDRGLHEGVGGSGVCIRDGWADPSPGTRKTDGTHPTEMLSCLSLVSQGFSEN